MLVQADENHIFSAASPVPKPGIFHTLWSQNDSNAQKCHHILQFLFKLGFCSRFQS